MSEPRPAGGAPPPRPMVPGRAVRALKRALLSRFLVDWVRPRWLALIGALGLTGCLAAATASYPWILKSSFDLLLKEGKADALLIVLGAIVGATLLRSLFLYLQTIATNRIVTELVTDIQKRIFARLVDADFARLTRESPGELVSRITNDVVYVQAAALAALNTAIRDALIIAGLIITMIVLDPIMSLIVLGVYPIAALPIALISERLRRVARRTQHELGDMTSRLTEKLSSARLVKTFRLERHVTAELERSFSDVQRLRMKAVRSRARLDPMLEALGGLAVAGVVGLAYWRISGGIATVGDFMGFVSALLLAAQPIRGIGNLAARLNEGLAALERVYDVLDEVPVVADRPGAAALAVARGEISFEHVSFAYAAPARPAAAAPDNLPARVAHAVVDLSLTVPGGQTVALVGRSGSGKSTVVNLVPRLFDVTAGAIRIDGQDVRDVTLASLRGAIAIVSQEVTLFDDTIAANIRLGRLEASEAEVEAAARAAAAHEFILEQPQGYQTVIGSSGARLSGGQRQRIALARAILKNAPILLLDEATSALDSESERLVQEALAAFTRGRTTLVVAHRLATVRSADLICVMEAGRLVDQGQHEALLTRGGIYAELCRGQLMDGEDPAGSPRP